MNKPEAEQPCEPRPVQTPPLWPFLIICFLVGCVVSLSGFHSHHCSDSLLPVLVSLQKWTPFFWGQDRVGMLVPLLTLPIRHPFWNLVAQDAIYLSTVLAAIYLLSRYMLPDGSYALAGTLSAAAFLGLAPATWVFDVSAGTFCGVWLALGLGGLVVASGGPWWRWLIGLSLLVLAHWTYLTTALLLGPLVVMRFLLCGRAANIQTDNGPSASDSTLFKQIWKLLRMDLSGQLLLLGISFAFGYLFYWLETIHLPGHTILGTLPIAEWPTTWWQLWNNQWRDLAPHHWPFFLFGIAFAGIVRLNIPAMRRQAAIAWRAAIAVAIAATVYFFFMGTRRWVFLNSCCARYAYPALFVFQASFAIFVVGFLTPAIGNRLGQLSYIPAGIVLLLAALINFQSPSVKHVHDDLERTYGLGGRAPDVLAAHCTHVAGDYWRVWPTVFQANLMLRDQQAPETVWGITLRGEVTWRQWKYLPLEKLRVAVPLEDKEIAQSYFKVFNLPTMVAAEQRSTIYVFRPACLVQAEQQQKSEAASLVARGSRNAEIRNSNP